jgi:diaminopimelate epimerase
MKVPFTKAHGAKNDFLLSWAAETGGLDLSATAIAICDRHAGVGADGWLIVGTDVAGCNGSIRLFNMDGTEPEISGNGTRCAAAFLVDAGLAENDIRILTGAGPKCLRLMEHTGHNYLFEMNMGTAMVEHVRYSLPLKDGPRDVTILNVGNPQCAAFVQHFDFEWRTVGAEIEGHPYFPKRTNVSFFRVMDEHTIDVRFFERGVGETMSSGTGSTGAAAAAMARGLVKSPVNIMTPAGAMDLRSEGENLFLTGPAEIVVKGEFFL